MPRREIPMVTDSEVLNLLSENVSLMRINLNDSLFGGTRVCICYTHPDDERDVIPLWMYGTGSFSVFVPVPEEDEPYMLVCQDELGDFYTYGMWRTLDELKYWLRNPSKLY